MTSGSPIHASPPAASIALAVASPRVTARTAWPSAISSRVSARARQLAAADDQQAGHLRVPAGRDAERRAQLLERHLGQARACGGARCAPRAPARARGRACAARASWRSSRLSSCTRCVHPLLGQSARARAAPPRVRRLEHLRRRRRPRSAPRLLGRARRPPVQLLGAGARIEDAEQDHEHDQDDEDPDHHQSEDLPAAHGAESTARSASVPLMDFALTDEQQLVSETARRFADNEIVPRAKENARNAPLRHRPRPQHRRAGLPRRDHPRRVRRRGARLHDLRAHRRGDRARRLGDAHGRLGPDLARVQRDPAGGAPRSRRRRTCRSCAPASGSAASA